MSDPIAKLMATYVAGLDDSPQFDTNINRLEQRVRGSLRERAASRQRSLQRLQFALAAAAVVAVGGTGMAYRLGQGSGRSTAPGAMPAGEWLSTTKSIAEERKFDDGSSVRLESESSARVQFVRDKGGLVHLDRGAVKLKVRHRDGSTWRVAAGPYEVEAIGTEFVVKWVAGAEKPLHVSVSEGTVAVRGPAFRGTRFVSAHQMVEVATPTEVASEPTPVATGNLAPKVVEAEPAVAAESTPNPLRPHAPEPSWRALEASGKYAEAVKAAERRGLSGIYQSGNGDELIALSRAARFASRMDVAHQALTACRSRFPGSPQAAMAAFLLGRSANAGQAARWFSTYLREQPNGALAREALGRLIEAHQAAGDTVSSRAAAERYLKSYPDGPHATLARQALRR